MYFHIQITNKLIDNKYKNIIYVEVKNWLRNAESDI